VLTQNALCLRHCGLVQNTKNITFTSIKYGCGTLYTYVRAHCILRLDIQTTEKRCYTIYKVNRIFFVLCSCIGIFIFLEYFPIPSQSIQGHFWEPDLDIEKDWQYLLVIATLFTASLLIYFLNKVTRLGFVEFSEDSIKLKIGKKIYCYGIDKVNYIELTSDKNLYIKANGNYFNLSLVWMNLEKLKRLHIYLNLQKNKTLILIRE